MSTLRRKAGQCGLGMVLWLIKYLAKYCWSLQWGRIGQEDIWKSQQIVIQWLSQNLQHIHKPKTVNDDQIMSCQKNKQTKQKKITYCWWDTNYIFVYISSFRDEGHFAICSEDSGNTNPCCLWMLWENSQEDYVQKLGGVLICPSRKCVYVWAHVC